MAVPSDSDDEIRSLRVRLSDAQAKATTLERWLDLTFETSPTAMGVISTFENRYVRANLALAELYGMPVEEILRRDPFSLAFSLTHPDELIAEQKLFAELAIGARPSYQLEKRIVRPDGSFRWGLLTFSAIFDDSADPSTPVGPLRFVVIHIVDITERKALAETLQHREAELRHAQKIDGIGRLAAGVAHDFNNLLTVIIGHTEVLKGLADDAGALPPGVLQEGLEAILVASERAASLTASLLAHGRRERVMPQAFVLSDEIRTLQRLLARTTASNIRVEESLTATGSIWADRGQIGQVVMNLVLNARDALLDGGRIRIATEDIVMSEDPGEAALPGPGEWVALLVSDTGHGMIPEVQARIFEPFFTTRADRPGTQGTGLGLATVQRIVAENGGHIGVTSAPGEGTTFTVFFPRNAGAVKEEQGPHGPARPAPPPNSQRVLVVDDEPSVRSLIANVLLGAHYRVMVARDGEEALRLIETEREPFHLIVTDLSMPRVGERALAKRLEERGSQPRILFVSGHSDHTAADLLPHGVLLSKPFTPRALLTAVSKALGW